MDGGLELVTRKVELAAREFELTCGFELAARGFELVARNDLNLHF